MSGFSDALENDVLDHMLGVSQWSYSAAQRTIGLHTGDPGEDGSANEVTGGSYARQNVTFSAATGGLTSNTGTVTFSGMPACTVTHVSVWDATTFLCGGALTSQKVLESGDEIYFSATNIDVGAD